MKKTLIFFFAFLSIASAQDTEGISIALVDGKGFINPIFHYENERWLNLFDDSYFDKYKHSKWYFTSFIKSVELKPDSNLKLIEKEGYYTRYGFNSDFSRKQGHRYFKYIGIGISKNINVVIFDQIDKESKTFKNVIEIVREAKFPRNRPYTNYENLSKYFGEELKLKISSINLYEADSEKFNLFYFYTNIEFGEGECKSHINYQGWIKEFRGNYQIINENFIVDGCDYKLTTNQIPLSLMYIENKFYVLSAEPLWSRRGYNIFSVSEKSLLKECTFDFMAN